MKITAAVVLATAAAAGAAVVARQGQGEESARPVVRTPAKEAKESPKGSDKAPLGSPEFYPSAERPIGWRGDGTGRYPAATPPVAWSRKAAGFTSTLKYQAEKPAGEPGKDAQALEYWTIKDWLVAGPFACDDPAKGLDHDYLGGESGAMPGKGAKAGESAWKFLRADVDTQSRHECNGGTCGNSNVDFVFAFGKIAGSPKPEIEGEFANKIAYAHTYIYAPADGKVKLQMPYDATCGRFWLNGKPTDLDPKNRNPSFDVTLTKGWNRLLVKLGTANALRAKNGDAEWASKWLVAAYLTPAGPVSYETKNVAWMTRMTGRSISQPIVVGERIFVGAAITDLMCIEKKTGKLLWVRTNSPYDALTPDERASVPGMAEKIEPLVKKLDAANEALVAAINANVSAQGMDGARQAEVDQKVKERDKTERAVHEAFTAADKKRFPGLQLNEVSPANATPVSDGKHVWWACGGSMWSSGSYLLACYDLEGKRVWTKLDNSLGAAEHGNHVSPILADGKLIYSAHQTLIAYDPATGKEIWRNKTTETSKDWTNTPGQAVPIVLGGTNVLLAHKSLYLASNGTAFSPSFVETFFTAAAPIVENGVVYDTAIFKGHGKPHSFVAVKLPPNTNGKAEVLWAPEGSEVSLPIRGFAYQIASCLYVDGLVYAIDMTGGLTVLDPANKKCAYKRWMDGYNRYTRFCFGYSASPTMAGKEKHIYLIDDAGYTHVIAPGPAYKEVARNVLENIHQSGHGGNPCRQESFYTSPVFEGSRMYLHGEEYLYCIGEK
ncbi:MAG: PQQ-binding-like beta-propeller repeat protein [Planctomycetota bacterium]|nr:PQQ-binding-like beta-propeller repeat protein [Planctomycetota bacterium]